MLQWILAESVCKCAGLMDVMRFDAMKTEGKNLVVYDPSHFERGTTSNAWKTQRKALS